MRDTFDRPDRCEFFCEPCNRMIATRIDGLFTNPRRGSIQRFCSPSCRQAAYRRRQAGVPENTPAQRNGGRNRQLKTGG
jgi:hypothetical protein